MTQYFIGTAGWSYKDWEGIVYPVQKPTSFHPLVFLANYIDIIEINSTFYRPPVIQYSISWIKKVESYQNFLFTVKLHQIFTHQRKDFSQKEIDQFKFGIEPLKAKERLAAILMQFPWSFASTPANREYLMKLFNFFSGYPLAIEVRHGSWNHPNFFTFLKKHDIAFCNIDQPLFHNSIPPTAISTNSQFAYVRLHGRNAENWFREDAGRDERYNYLYTKKELKEWIEHIKILSQHSKNVYVITNNHYRGQALANALQLKNMLTGKKFDIPKPMLANYPVLEELTEEEKFGQLGLFPKNSSESS